MKKAVCVGLVVVMGLVLSGCPVMIGANIAKDLLGKWQWIQAAAVLSQSVIDNIGEDNGYDSEEVANDFANAGRLRKTVTFSEGGGFTYLLEQWVPDREPEMGQSYNEETGEYTYDNGAGVNWDWQQMYYVEGTYQTGAYQGQTSMLTSELYVNVSKYTVTYREYKDDPDNFDRALYRYVQADASSDASNPLGMYALLGMNPFDQLLIAWNEYFDDWKEFNVNAASIEVYLPVN